MQANSAEHDSLEVTSTILGATPILVDNAAMNPAIADNTIAESAEVEENPISFHGHFDSCMEMYADAATVGQYLDAHRDWFPRCAHPMQVKSIGVNGYDLTIGRFGSFGYEVEAKIGLDLLPQDHGVYRIQTIPIPGYEPPGYEVDFRARLELVETAGATPATRMTRVEWDLDLQVTVQFPRFIYALPQSLVQSTGDRLLNQIVRQVSRCLTRKVQEDFHRLIGVEFSKKRRFGGWGKGKTAE